ncbi:uncharacterized protein LOC113779480 [Coffea eugenioides]|uniref:uncharacterized protein LOC113779480 n=1 Tax=Coffea eugenioides TaxID=49369 RepID=UPI000F6110F9|nr:uncharacterized protein LOC113779480 [Coffea eugenioides]
MVLGEKGSLSLMNKGGVKSSAYVHGMSCISTIDSPEICNEDGRCLVEEKVVGKETKREDFEAMKTCCSSSSTSSIGKNSDVSGRSVENPGDSAEVQSSYKGPLDAMEALEEVLPIRRGISSFYNGKSKSFASLADAASSTSSIKDIGKPENAYIRKRRNQLACSLAWDSNKSRSSPLRSNSGGVSKRVINSGRTSLALAVTMSSSGIYHAKNENASPGPKDMISASPPSLLGACHHSQFRDYHLHNGSSLAAPPPRQNFSAWRSLSLADLQQCVSITAACTSSSTSRLDIKPSKT